ncbi:MAG: phosphate acetyltransferase [Actinobacteria bacterium]|nr:phosphate acetyltransferase [Actinomycetota bacterium]
MSGPTVIYISSLEPNSGKSLVTFGVVDMVSRLAKVKFFRPVVGAGAEDAEINRLRERFRLDQSYEESFGVTTEETRALGENVERPIVHEILTKFENLSRDCDAVVIEGTDFTGASAAFEFALNAELAANLGASAILVQRGHRHRAEQVKGALSGALASYTDRDVPLLGLIINRVRPGQLAPMRKVAADIPGVPVWLLPEIPELLIPSLADVQQALGAQQLIPAGDPSARMVAAVLAGAMGLDAGLGALTQDCLLVTPGDRTDLLLLAGLHNQSKGAARLSGVIATGGVRPAPEVMQLLEGLPDAVPVLGTDLDTVATVRAIDDAVGTLALSDNRKLDLAIRAFEAAIDTETLVKRARITVSDTVTPAMFERRLRAKAREHRRRIVLPEGNDDRILIAADHVLASDTADLTILGDIDEIETRAGKLGLSISRARLMDPRTDPLRKKFAGQIYQARKDKGLSEAAAYDLAGDWSWFGTMLVYNGDVDGMVSGACHTTANTIRPALQIIKTEPGVDVVSSVFLMALKHQVLVFGDCAVIPDPDAGQLADIALSSARTARDFGIEPRVAMLSYSSGTSGAGPEVAKVAEATRLAKERDPELVIEGPIQYDAAIDPVVGQAKLPGSDVAGHATVFVFPDLNTGNSTYKAVQRSSGAIAMGPVLQGLRLPVNDLSRGATVTDIVNTIVITAIQAGRKS